MREWLGCLVVGCIIAIAGCGEGGGGASCATSDECSGGAVCIDGRCQRRIDSGGGDRDAGGADRDAAGRRDAFVPPELDAGPVDLDSGPIVMMDSGGFALDADTDSDGITDFHEDRATGTDTDGDGVPDWMDDDSDGDGVPDAIEAGDAAPTTPPIDSDFDGVDDYRDTDSDDNGVLDAVEGALDRDADLRPDYRDRDNDGDGLDDTVEIGVPASPTDTDGDGTPDYDEPDSDADTIADEVEGLVDTDADLTYDLRDLDTDGDGYSDAAEAGDADLSTPPVDTDGDLTADFRDPDSDADGLSDAAELAGGTSRTSADSDGDGVSDLIEVGAGTRPLDPTDSPRTRGDFVFLEPYMMAPDPTRDTLQFSTSLQRADVYFLMDNTGSMGGTISALQSGLTSTVIPAITTDIPEAWFGVGGFDDYPLPGSIYAYGLNPCGSTGYGTNAPDSAGIRHDVPFFQYQTMTSSPSAAQTAVNRYQVNCGEDGPESGVAALYALASRNTLSGYARFAGSGSTPPTCPAGHRGAACFRGDAVPIVIVMTDVDQHNSPTCDPSFWGFGACDYAGVPGGGPTWAQMTTALAGINARVVGIATNTYANAFLTRLVQDTTIARGAPGAATEYVVSAPGGSGLSGAITTLVRRASQVPLDVSASAVDIADPGESVDAIAAFLDHLETRGTAAPGLTCTTGFATVDRVGIDTDSFPDTFQRVTPGSPVCFDIIPKMNTTVAPTLEPQLFRARINVVGDGFTPLDSRVIYFLVPPRVPDPNE